MKVEDLCEIVVDIVSVVTLSQMNQHSGYKGDLQFVRGPLMIVYYHCDDIYDAKFNECF